VLPARPHGSRERRFSQRARRGHSRSARGRGAGLTTGTDREQRPSIRPEEIARVFIRPLGSVLPLGFFAFGTGAFLTAALSLGWLPDKQAPSVFHLLLVFVVPLQAGAAVFAFLARDTAGGTAMSLFAATWATTATLSLPLKPGETSAALGTFLLVDGVVIATIAIASLLGNPAFAVVLGVACSRFAFSGLYELTGSTGLEHAAGWLGLALSAVAGYAGLAFLLEDAAHEPVLPFLRHGPARHALDADLIDHLRRLESEPGVRTRL
jgi:succinate-acetate transporter protein